MSEQMRFRQKQRLTPEKVMTIMGIDEKTGRINAGNMHTNMERYNQMAREHTFAMMDAGFGMKRSILNKKDRIDLMPLIENGMKIRADQYPAYRILNSDAYTIWKNSLTTEEIFCACIPCFQEMVIRANKERWLYIQTKEIDIQSRTVTLFLQDYSSSIFWKAGCLGTGTLQIKETGKICIELANDVVNPRDIHYMMPDGLNWTKEQIEWYRRMSDNITRDIYDKMEQEGTSPFYQLFLMTITYINLTNYMLHAEKPRIIREPKSVRNTAKDTAAKSQMPDTKRPRIRTVGTVIFTSMKMPKAPNMDSVRHYKTAVWKAKGGVRHMKDGRIIPFKECIKKRKALADTLSEEQVKQIVIRLTDNAPKA